MWTKIELLNSVVNMKPTDGNMDGYSTGEEIVATVTGWKVVNQEPNSYLVRHWNNTWFTYASDATHTSGKDDLDNNRYRFAGKTAITTGLYRTYFGEDEKFGDALVGHVPTDEGTFTINMGAGKPLYCYENTMDVAMMKIQNTTCAVVVVELQKHTKFTDAYEPITVLYRIDDDFSTFYNETGAKNMVKTKAFALNSISDVFGTIYLKGIDKVYMRATDVVFKTRASDGTREITSITFQLYSDAGCSTAATTAQVYTDASLTTPIGSTSSTVTSGDILTNLNAAIKVYQYVGANESSPVKAYYTIPIKHFGDWLTPWDTQTGSDLPTVADSYPAKTGETSATKGFNCYLGRYGVLRNNWYSLEVTGVSRIGSPIDPTTSLKTDPTPDDKLNSYLKCRINILSWAKRTQNVTLQ